MAAAAILEELTGIALRSFPALMPACRARRTPAASCFVCFSLKWRRGLAPAPGGRGALSGCLQDDARQCPEPRGRCVCTSSESKQGADFVEREAKLARAPDEYQGPQ